MTVRSRFVIMAAALTAAPVLALAAEPSPASIGNPTQGKADFAICSACHQVGPDAKNSIGPELNGIVGAKAGEDRGGFEFSSALKNANLTWTVDNLQKWLANPQKMVSGTKMVFPGYPSEKMRNDVIAYLATFGPDGKQTEASK